MDGCGRRSARNISLASLKELGPCGLIRSRTTWGTVGSRSFGPVDVWFITLRRLEMVIYIFVCVVRIDWVVGESGFCYQRGHREGGLGFSFLYWAIGGASGASFVHIRALGFGQLE